jgi:hypothetical protein
MEMPRHHRDEAQTCLELARLMIDPHAARILRAAAAQHFVQAIELEAVEASPPSVPKVGLGLARERAQGADSVGGAANTFLLGGA